MICPRLVFLTSGNSLPARLSYWNLKTYSRLLLDLWYRSSSHTSLLFWLDASSLSSLWFHLVGKENLIAVDFELSDFFYIYWNINYIVHFAYIQWKPRRMWMTRCLWNECDCCFVFAVRDKTSQEVYGDLLVSFSRLLIGWRVNKL